jgi:radical SAM superfamily enzyme YgiQ (UPF0313 family)
MKNAEQVPRILLAQLPVPPAGVQTMDANIPLASAFLKLHAKRLGLERHFEIELFPVELVNSLGDQGLLRAILEYRPDVVGFTCYVWNIERTLWLAEQIKKTLPQTKILVGGPEITADNHWVLENPSIDHAVFGEGETAFTELLHRFRESGLSLDSSHRTSHSQTLLDPLDLVSSPYTAGVLNAVPGKTMLIETVRGCRFRCKYCYYSKRNAQLRYLSYGAIEKSLRHALECGASEVYLLDPTINQRPDFVEFLELLARINADRRFTFSGELRAEGIDRQSAKLLRAANFAELEIGLQSVEPLAARMMGRPIDLEKWEHGVRALMAEGIRVRLDLILGLPGDTIDSVRRGLDFLAKFRPDAEFQIFNLSILPGTDFRREATALGLHYQPKPPYHVLRTPTLDVESVFMLMEEAEETLGIEFDSPALPFEIQENAAKELLITLDLDDPAIRSPAPQDFSLITTLHLRSSDFSRVESAAIRAVSEAIRSNPHITLQIVLEPTGDPAQLRIESLEKVLAECFSTTSYLDRYYSLHPGHLLGAKRLFILLPVSKMPYIPADWLQEVANYALILWHGLEPPCRELGYFEHIVMQLQTKK